MGVKSNSAEVIERTNIFKEVLQSYNIPLSSVVFWEEDFSYTKAYLAVEKYYQKQNKVCCVAYFQVLRQCYKLLQGKIRPL